VPSIHNSIRDAHCATLDPVPKTTAGQARFFFYDADDAEASVASKDFDDMYKHGRSREFKEVAEDKDEMTFGSRPPTAP